MSFLLGALVASCIWDFFVGRRLRRNDRMIKSIRAEIDALEKGHTPP